jgi:hypothetical protein
MIGRWQQHVRRLIGVGAIAVLLVVAGSILMRVGRPDRPESREAPTERVHDQAATTGGADRVGGESGEEAGGRRRGGFSRDEAGAVAAAVAYTGASQRWLYLGDEEIADEVARIATPRSMRSLTSEVVAEIGTARDDLARSSGRVWWLVHPLAWRVESYDADRASVAVWTVTVLSASGVALPQSEWMTVTVDLEWVDGNWRVDAIRDRPGPTPMTGPHDEPWDAEPFDEALAGFTRLGGEPDS